MRRSRTWQRLQGRRPKSLGHVVTAPPEEPPRLRRRRRRVVAVTALLGGSLLGRSLSAQPDSREFYGETLAVAAVWTTGGLLSGPLHLGWIAGQDEQLRRPWLVPVATGVGAFGFFAAAALVARRIPVLGDAVRGVLLFAEEGEEYLVLLTTLANGLGEEVFFRGALYAAAGSHPVATSTLVHALVTSTTRNPALVLAAAVMGTLLGLQRRASQGLQAPVLTHLTWSALMVRYLPRLVRRPAAFDRAAPAGPPPSGSRVAG